MRFSWTMSHAKSSVPWSVIHYQVTCMKNLCYMMADKPHMPINRYIFSSLVFKIYTPQKF